jgi:hypothetical protein
VNFVPRSWNPANLPQARPVEDFWGLLKSKVNENDWAAKSFYHLMKKIVKCLKEIQLDLVQRFSMEVPKRLDSIRRHDV